MGSTDKASVLTFTGDGNAAERQSQLNRRGRTNTNGDIPEFGSLEPVLLDGDAVRARREIEDDEVTVLVAPDRSGNACIGTANRDLRLRDNRAGGVQDGPFDPPRPAAGLGADNVRGVRKTGKSEKNYKKCAKNILRQFRKIERHLSSVFFSKNKYSSLLFGPARIQNFLDFHSGSRPRPRNVATLTRGWKT